jgi:hypothetical protein
MPEETPTEVPLTPATPPEATNEPKIELTQEAFKQVLQRAGEIIKEDLSKDAPTKTDIDEVVKRAVAENTARIAENISGKKPGKQVDPMLEPFVNNTSGMINGISDYILEQVDERADARENKMREETRAQAKLHQDRPDITTDVDNIEMFNQFYETTDPNDPPQKRAEEAAKKYDKLLEKAGKGDSKARIAAASSMPSAGNSGASVGEPKEKSSQEILLQEQEARQERYNKIRNVGI